MRVSTGECMSVYEGLRQTKDARQHWVMDVFVRNLKANEGCASALVHGCLCVKCEDKRKPRVSTGAWMSVCEALMQTRDARQHWSMDVCV